MKPVDLKNKSAASMLLFVMERGNGVFEKPSRNERRAQDEICDKLEALLGESPSEKGEETMPSPTGGDRTVKVWKFKYEDDGQPCSFEMQEDRWKIVKDQWVKFDKSAFGRTKAYRDARRCIDEAFGIED